MQAVFDGAKDLFVNTDNSTGHLMLKIFSYLLMLLLSLSLFLLMI